MPLTNQQLLPVIFYIHGGSFQHGSGDINWCGPSILLDKNVVMVAFNYRLGPLGFLSTGDDIVPGNNGLKDQNLALKWVKGNIAAFGGDPELITVVGHSAGAASAHFHLLSPLSKDLIKGAIAQSGTVFDFWALARQGQGIKNARKLATLLNCPNSPSQGMVDCLRKMDAYLTVKLQLKFLEWAHDPIIPFRPVVEPNIKGAFLPEEPLDILVSGKAANVPFMTGITTEDGAMKVADYFNYPSLIEELNENFNKLMPIILEYSTNDSKDKISRMMRKFYFADRNISRFTKTELANMFTDTCFLMGADDTVRLHARYTNQPVYYYLFGYRGSESFCRLVGDPTHNYGVCHVDELLHLLNLDTTFPKYKPTESDKRMSEVMTTLWEHFAHEGDPTPTENSVIPVRWEPVRSENLEYYAIRSPTDMEMAKGLFAERADFLRDLDLYSRNNRIKTEL